MNAELTDGFVTLTPLLTIRVGAALRLVPFFWGRPLPLLPWAAISLCVALVLTPLRLPLVQVSLFSGPWVALALKELFIGVVIGSMARLAFLVLDAAGELLRVSTLTVGTGMGADPQRGAALDRFYVLVGTAVFLLVGGHHALFAGMASSVQCLPPETIPHLETMITSGISAPVRLFGTAMATAVMIAAPLFVAGLIADFLVALAARMVPGAGQQIGAQAIRLVFVQLVLLATFGAIVTVAVGFIQRSLQEVLSCATWVQ